MPIPPAKRFALGRRASRRAGVPHMNSFPTCPPGRLSMTSASVVALPQTSYAFEVDFAPSRRRVGAIRRTTMACLGLWDMRGPLAENIVLTVSELVTNAIEHGEGDIALRVQCADDELQVAVTDGSPSPASLRAPNDDDDSGRGLLLVTALAERWGTRDDGKTTWCVFRVPAGRR
ncbi:ATP-binding protein [Streptomyces sp. NPDC102381]|uniref:ATP-binding protein n=1 Tax=Streptomyces sp. NPDC102381 TaxID=3366164 RepID=UPI00382EF354